MAAFNIPKIQNDLILFPEPHEHRLRNLIAIQIRNFTPFPVRDAVTSSLAMTGPPPQDSMDDIELALNRRRSRRISTNSLGAVRSIRAGADINLSDTQLVPKMEASPGRPRANSRAPRISHPSTFQRPQRERASSSTSVQTLSRYGTVRQHASPSVEDVSPPTSPAVASPEIAQLQKSLEQVMASRLVETFLSLEPWLENDGPSPNAASQSGRTVGSKAEPSSARIRSGSSASRTMSPRSPVFQDKPSPKFGTLALHQSSRSESPASARNAKGRQSMPSTLRTLSPRSKPPEINRTTSTSYSLPTPAPSPPPEAAGDQVPFYISPFHRPSTNPSFASLDVKHDFAPWVDLSGHRFKTSIWGHGGEWGKLEDPGQKGKSPMLEDESNQRLLNGDWSILASWDVDMDDLKPLPPDFASQPSILPSNTLVVRLSPSGDFYYLPGGQGVTPNVGRSGSRPPSPSVGYSDTEVDDRTLRRAKRRASLSIRTDVVNKSMRETKMKKSAGFGDLLNMVTLQSVISDTKVQLDEIIEACDRLLGENTISSLQREISQKQEELRVMNEDHQAMLTSTDSMKSRLDERKAELRRRRELLEGARELHEQEKGSLRDLREQVDDERRRHTTLINTLIPVRTTLLQTVSSIFPIEPIEPKDLLFGILALPLPIPTGANDPAPPLTLQGDGSYNDETMASALGYVAQVVSLLTAYLGDLPPYPVVCQGSRSLIKDPISAMMGPRMFPLYSRGVDTYRFEYGVFLLNKNIELLMSERDLRSMDLRHTLPNLKNLLLTLTSGEAAVLKPRARKKGSNLSRSESLMTDSTMITTDPSDSRDPSPSPIPSDHESEGTSGQIEPTLPTTPTASKIVIEPDEADATVTASNSASTIVETSQATRKSFYSPLATFLRTRYPSVRTASTSTPPPLLNVKVEVEMPSETATSTNNEAAVCNMDEIGDTDETSTIRGSIRSRFALFQKAGEEEVAK